MNSPRLHPFWTIVVVMALAPFAESAEPVTLENVKDPGPNRLDEPVAEKFSLDRAVDFLDSASLTWQKQRQCFTCHTNYAYLFARPAIASDTAAHRAVRSAAEELVAKRWEEKGPRWDAEVVATAGALAYNDALTTGKLHPMTRKALDRMWTVQREDGGWDWIKCNWPPLESDDHYGVTMAAIAVGVAPGDYQKTEAAQKGLAGIRRYFKNNPPTTVHHEAMILWSSAYIDDLMTQKEKKAVQGKLFALQKQDGGWALATLGDWKRADSKEQDTQSSDGYATGFVMYVLLRAGVDANDPRIQKGITWLKMNQRESGRWITRSLNRDNKHFISHAGTAFALMALAECGEIKRESAPRGDTEQ